MSMSYKVAEHPLMFAAMLITAATGAIGFASLSDALSRPEKPAPGDIVDIQYASVPMAEIEKQIAEMRVEMSKWPRPAPSPLSPSGEVRALRVEMAALRAELKAARTRQAAIEKVILADPGKALEVPMLRRDLDDAKAAQAKDVVYLTQAIDRSYNILIGGLIALVVAILLMALDRFIGPRRRRSPE